MLILQGGKDFQVLPTVDFARFQELLQGRDKVEFRLYDELNHLFGSDDVLDQSPCSVSHSAQSCAQRATWGRSIARSL